MTRTRISSLMMLGALCAAPATHAAVDLVAEGAVSGLYEDFATQTSAPLESHIPGNRLGGMGSGLGWVGGNTFLMLPDRGPNASRTRAWKAWRFRRTAGTCSA